MKRDAESSWATERVENALLRERINDIAAEVARLTAALEGPGSPIEAMLASDKPAMRPDAHVNGTSTGEPMREQPQGNLADRIRALQSKASRVTALLTPDWWTTRREVIARERMSRRKPSCPGST